MDYANVLTIIGVLGAFIFFLQKRTDKSIDGLSSEISEMRREIRDLDKRVSRIEDRIEFSGKIIYIKTEKEDYEEN